MSGCVQYGWAIAPLPTRRPQPAIPLHPHHPQWRCTADADTPRVRQRPKRKRAKASRMLNVMDDMTLKKYGRGNIFYGDRELAGASDDDDDTEPEMEILSPNAVLVAGGTGRTGQWITLGLLNQGFNVRVLTRSFERAESLFGESGANVNVFEGDLSDPAPLADATAGAAAVVFAAAAPWWQPAGAAVAGRGAANLAEAARKAGTVKRFVLVSAGGAPGAEAERALRESGVEHVVVRAAKLQDREGGLEDIEVSLAGGEAKGVQGTLTRVDLAQVVCQALVHDRFIRRMQEEDPGGGFVFPSCTVTAANGSAPFVPDPMFWRRSFSKLVAEAGSDEDEAILDAVVEEDTGKA